MLCVMSKPSFLVRPLFITSCKANAYRSSASWNPSINMLTWNERARYEQHMIMAYVFFSVEHSKHAFYNNSLFKMMEWKYSPSKTSLSFNLMSCKTPWITPFHRKYFTLKDFRLDVLKLHTNQRWCRLSPNTDRWGSINISVIHWNVK